MDTTIKLQSIITCPNCGHQKEETMLTDACQFFYTCEKCKTRLKPKQGDSWVYCSYGTVVCPSKQHGIPAADREGDVANASVEAVSVIK